MAAIVAPFVPLFVIWIAWKPVKEVARSFEGQTDEVNAFSFSWKIVKMKEGKATQWSVDQKMD